MADAAEVQAASTEEGSEEQEREKSPEELYQEAQKLESEEKNVAALHAYSQLLDKQPEWHEARFRRGILQARESFLEQALKDWNQALADESFVQEFRSGALADELGPQVDNAIKHFAFETTVDPTAFRPHLYYAEAARLFNRPEDALKGVQGALTLSPDCEPALEILEQFGNDAQKIAILETAHEAKPMSSQLNMRLGRLYAKTNKTALAIKHLQEAISGDPSLWEAKLELGKIYQAQTRYEDADKMFSEALSQKPGNVPLLLARAECAKQTYQFNLAVDFYEKALASDPNNAELHEEFIELCRQTGVLSRAQKSLERRLDSGEDDPSLRADVARASLQKNDFETAVKHFHLLVEANPEDAELVHSLGLALEGMKQPEQALEMFNKAVELDGSKIDYQASLGRALAAAGRHEEAIPRLREAARQNPNNVGTQVSLAQALQKAGDAKGALEAYTVASRLAPEDPDVQFQLGNLHLAAGNSDEAQTAFKDCLKHSKEPQAGALFGLGQVYSSKGLDEIAADFYKQVLEFEPSSRPAATAVVDYFLAEDRQGLPRVFDDLMAHHKGDLARAGQLVGCFKALLEPRQELELCVDLLDAMHRSFSTHPEISREQARLYATWSTQLYSSEGPAAALAALERLAVIQPNLQEIKPRIEQLKAEVGPPDEPEAVEAPPEPAMAMPAPEPIAIAPPPPAVSAPPAVAPPAPAQPIVMTAPPTPVSLQPAPPPSPLLTEQLFKLQLHGYQPTQQAGWMRAVGHHLMTTAARSGITYPAPDDTDSLVNLYSEFAARLAGDGWVEQAASILHAALLVQADHEIVLKQLGELYKTWSEQLVEQGRFAEAITLLEGFLELVPGDQETHYLVAGHYTAWAVAAEAEGQTAVAQALRDRVADREHLRQTIETATAAFLEAREQARQARQTAEQAVEFSQDEIRATVEAGVAAGVAEASRAAEPAPPETVAPTTTEAPQPTEAPEPAEPVPSEAAEPESEPESAAEEVPVAEASAVEAVPPEGAEPEASRPEAPEPEPAPVETPEPAAEPEPEPEPAPVEAAAPEPEPVQAEATAPEAAPAAEAPPAEEAAPAADLDAATCEQRLGSDPTDTVAFEALFGALGDDKAVVKALRDLVNKHADEPDHLLNLARGYSRTGADTMAVIQYQKYVKVKPTIQGYEELASTYERLGKEDLAALIRKKADKHAEDGGS
ncbi:MAG: tetratricopeptide repeat protein [Vulcanimicrobiota bacterium]